MTVGELKKYLEKFPDERKIIFLKQDKPLSEEWDAICLRAIFAVLGTCEE